MPETVILGGGPAGAAAALTVARAGHTALLVDAGPRPGGGEGAFPVGEALPGAARPLLAELGLLETTANGGHLDCVGNVSAWESPTPIAHDFLLDPNGGGWHLDRCRFDADLRRAARAAGARHLRRTRVVGGERRDGRWRLRVRHADGRGEELRCHWVIDASGRGGFWARRQGVRRLRQDRLLAFAARYHPRTDAAPCTDARTWIEAMPDGWAYTAPLPGGDRVVALHAEADFARRAALGTGSGFGAALALAPALAPLLDAYDRSSDSPRCLDASSGRLERVTGEGWLAVGDAAVSFDPISSQGLFNALYTGLRGAEAVVAALAGDATACAAYEERMLQVHDAYLDHRSTYYAAAAQRWPKREFWRRQATTRISENTFAGSGLANR